MHTSVPHLLRPKMSRSVGKLTILPNRIAPNKESAAKTTAGESNPFSLRYRESLPRLAWPVVWLLHCVQQAKTSLWKDIEHGFYFRGCSERKSCGERNSGGDVSDICHLSLCGVERHFEFWMKTDRVEF